MYTNEEPVPGWVNMMKSVPGLGLGVGLGAIHVVYVDRSVHKIQYNYS